MGIILIICLVLFTLIGLYNGVQITNYTYKDEELPKEFDGFRIVFLTDFHCKVFGKNENKLIQTIDSCTPDLVVFTGDMIDGEHKDIAPVQQLLAGLTGKYPMYAVSGNHEKDNLSNYKILLGYYKKYGVIDLDNQSLTVTRNNASIGVYGLPYQDRYFIKKTGYIPDKDEHEFNILLYHDATVFPFISRYGYNLVLSGHTHGGIIRIPFLGGLISNKGTLFSEFDSGMYQRNGSTLISSRGIGDSYVPRFYNRPEVVCITLRTEKE